MKAKVLFLSENKFNIELSLQGSETFPRLSMYKSFGFRLSGVIADRWEAGASYYRGAWDDGGDFNLTMYGLHLMEKITRRKFIKISTIKIDGLSLKVSPFIFYSKTFSLTTRSK